MSTEAAAATAAAEATLAAVNSTIDHVGSTFLEPLKDVNFLFLEFQLVASAMGIIYLGSHAAMRRPPSAAPPKDKKSGKRKEDDDGQFTQGLELSDAIMFPIMAGCVLMGLYYLIQWLKDPAILTKILKYYMSTVSVASMVTLYAHGMGLVVSFIFPKYFRGRDGRLRKVCQASQQVVVCDDESAKGSNDDSKSLTNPLPLPLSLLAPTQRTKAAAWRLRHLFTRHWIFKLFVHGSGEERANVSMTTILAIPLAAITAFFYFKTDMPFLSNMLGYAMCYCSLIILSPTDLLTGSLVLVGLFIYDIVMVFYT